MWLLPGKPAGCVPASWGTRFAIRRTVPLRHALALALAFACFGTARAADAAGLWLSKGNATPILERVAVASSGGTSTLWTSVRFEATAKTAVGILLPVPPSSIVARTSDAWFEALEIATAPRIFPPEAVTGSCPGETQPVHPFDVAGDLGHAASVAPVDLTIVADLAGALDWATQHGFVVSPETATALASPPGSAFVAASFTLDLGTSSTPTLRVVMPGVPPTLPLSLSSAGDADLPVVAWVLGAGAGSATGAVRTEIPSSKIVWNAATGESNYRDALEAALADAGPAGVVVDAASHDALAIDTSLANGTASIAAVAATYFQRASAYGDATMDPGTCTTSAASVLASGTPVGRTCARGDLWLGDPAVCTESPAPGTLAPDALRCGAGADDLAVTLSELVPVGAFVTRLNVRIAAGRTGLAFPLALGGNDSVVPVENAGSVDASACESKQTSSSGATSGGATTGSGGLRPVRIGGGTNGVTVQSNVNFSNDGSCDCSGTAETAAVEGGDGSGDGSETSTDSSSSGDSCGGDTQDSSSGDCGGDTSSSSGDDCSGDSGGGDGCSGDSGDSCSGDGGDSCSGGSGDSCSGGGADGCSGDCALGRHGARRGRSPRLSAMTFALLLLVAPLRRSRRPRRRPAKVARPSGPGAPGRRA